MTDPPIPTDDGGRDSSESERLIAVPAREGPRLDRERGRVDLSVAAERVVVVGVRGPRDAQYEADESLRELEALIDTAGGVVVDRFSQRVLRPAPGKFLGSGKVREIAERVGRGDVDMVAVDTQLTSRQVRNLEEELRCRVLDRSEVILDIFAAHARTHQARVQVELAQLRYTGGRLRRMWTHLSRVEGGIGSKGPGEKQLETDRRLIRKRIDQLERELKGIGERKAREVDVRSKGAVTVGLVGYTNAGKSTLASALTGSELPAADRLFHTLETRTRRWELGEGLAVPLSDTVGFIRNLPHHLVASFHATLEEAAHASLLLHVVDASHPEAQLQVKAVEEVLAQLGLEDCERVLVLNKADAIRGRTELPELTQAYDDHVLVSAQTGEGLEALTDRVRRHVLERMIRATFLLPYGDRRQAEIENMGMELERSWDEQGTTLTGYFWPAAYGRLTSLGLEPTEVSGPVPGSDDEDDAAPAPVRPVQSRARRSSGGEWPDSIGAAAAAIEPQLDEAQRATLVELEPDELRDEAGLCMGLCYSLGLWSGNDALLDACAAVLGKAQCYPEQAAAVVLERVREALIEAGHEMGFEDEDEDEAEQPA